jgi:hypothetical protein
VPVSAGLLAAVARTAGAAAPEPLDELTTSGRSMTPDLRAGCLRQLSATPAVVCLDNAETPWEADTLGTEKLFGQLAHVGPPLA